MNKFITRFSLLMMPLLLLGCASLSNNSGQLTQLQKENADLKAENQSLKTGVEESARQSKAQLDALSDMFQTEIKHGELTVTQYKNILKVEVAERIFFKPGSTKLKDSGKEVLKKLGETINAMPDTVARVIARTDNVPLKARQQTLMANNWDLSALRAAAVAKYLQEAGVNDDRLVAIGRGENDPIALNDTEPGRKQNRRIEIGIVSREIETGLGEIESAKSTDQHPQ